ncbi:MAG: phosphomannomutase [Salinirussus sp.]
MALFGTAGIRGPVESEVTPDLALAIGQAVATEAGTVVLGRDARPTGEALTDALAAGLESGGARVLRIGQVPTPATAFASQGRYGVMVTASHNPPPDNGIKLFVDGTEFAAEAEQRITERLDAGAESVSWNRWTGSHSASFLHEYREAVGTYVQAHGTDPDGLPIAVDCGNGTAARATPQVLTDLGARVHALNADLDGSAPARPSKPTAETLADLRAYVAESGCVLGLGHDGDGDRLVVVDADGEVVHAATIIAVLAYHYVARSDAADPVVLTTPNASGRIDERVGAAGGRVERVALGSLHEGLSTVRDDTDDGTVVVFAAEPWKHLHPGFGSWIDAVVSAGVLTRLVADQGLESLIAPVSEPPAHMDNIDCPEQRKEMAMTALREALPERFPDATVDESHGLRLTFPDESWLLVRPSGTEPKLRLYGEGAGVEDRMAAVRTAAMTAIED